MSSPDWEIIDHPIYKYRLKHAYNHVLRHFEPLPRLRAKIVHDDWVYVCLSGDGLMHCGRGYAWDGSSGGLDTMRMALPTLIHDALYQLIAEQQLPLKPWKAHADNEFLQLMRECGIPAIVSWWRFAVVRVGGRARDQFRPDGLHRDERLRLPFQRGGPR